MSQSQLTPIPPQTQEYFHKLSTTSKTNYLFENHEWWIKLKDLIKNAQDKPYQEESYTLLIALMKHLMPNFINTVNEQLFNVLRVKENKEWIEEVLKNKDAINPQENIYNQKIKTQNRHLKEAEKELETAQKELETAQAEITLNQLTAIEIGKMNGNTKGIWQYTEKLNKIQITIKRIRQIQKEIEKIQEEKNWYTSTKKETSDQIKTIAQEQINKYEHISLHNEQYLESIKKLTTFNGMNDTQVNEFNKYLNILLIQYDDQTIFELPEVVQALQDLWSEDQGWNKLFADQKPQERTRIKGKRKEKRGKTGNEPAKTYHNWFSKIEWLIEIFKELNIRSGDCVLHALNDTGSQDWYQTWNNDYFYQIYIKNINKTIRVSDKKDSTWQLLHATYIFQGNLLENESYKKYQNQWISCKIPCVRITYKKKDSGGIRKQNIKDVLNDERNFTNTLRLGENTKQSSPEVQKDTTKLSITHRYHNVDKTIITIKTLFNNGIKNYKEYIEKIKQYNEDTKNEEIIRENPDLLFNQLIQKLWLDLRIYFLPHENGENERKNIISYLNAHIRDNTQEKRKRENRISQIPTIYNAPEKFDDLIKIIKTNRIIRNFWDKTPTKLAELWIQSVKYKGQLSVILWGRVPSEDPHYKSLLIQSYMNPLNETLKTSIQEQEKNMLAVNRAKRRWSKVKKIEKGDAWIDNKKNDTLWQISDIVEQNGRNAQKIGKVLESNEIREFIKQIAGEDKHNAKINDIPNLAAKGKLSMIQMLYFLFNIPQILKSGIQKDGLSIRKEPKKKLTESLATSSIKQILQNDDVQIPLQDKNNNEIWLIEYINMLIDKNTQQSK